MASSEVPDRSSCFALLRDADGASCNQMDLVQRKGPHHPLGGMASHPASHHHGKERGKSHLAI